MHVYVRNNKESQILTAISKSINECSYFVELALFCFRTHWIMVKEESGRLDNSAVIWRRVHERVARAITRSGYRKPCLAIRNYFHGTIIEVHIHTMFPDNGFI